MILYATKQTIERFKIQIFEDIQSANKDLAKKVIEEQQNDELLEWGIKLFYFDALLNSLEALFRFKMQR